MLAELTESNLFENGMDIKIFFVRSPCYDDHSVTIYSKCVSNFTPEDLIDQRNIKEEIPVDLNWI